MTMEINAVIQFELGSLEKYFTYITMEINAIIHLRPCSKILRSLNSDLPSECSYFYVLMSVIITYLYFHMEYP